MNKEAKSGRSSHVFDLAERTALFGEEGISFAHKIPVTPIMKPLISQFVRAGTSIGANYCEADEADSRRDFFYKIGLCKREAKETKYWLRMIVNAVPDLEKEAQGLLTEVQELVLIFAAIQRKERAKARESTSD